MINKKANARDELIKLAGAIHQGRASVGKFRKEVGEALSDPKKLKKMYEGDNPSALDLEKFKKQLIEQRDFLSDAQVGIDGGMKEQHSKLYGKHSPRDWGEEAMRSLQETLLASGVPKTDPEVRKATKAIKELKDLRMDRGSHGFDSAKERRKAINRDISYEETVLGATGAYAKPGSPFFRSRSFQKLPRRIRSEALRESKKAYSPSRSGMPIKDLMDSRAAAIDKRLKDLQTSGDIRTWDPEAVRLKAQKKRLKKRRFESNALSNLI